MRSTPPVSLPPLNKLPHNGYGIVKEMKIAVISSSGSLNTADLLQAAETFGAESASFALRDLAFATETLDEHPFFGYDAYIFRGYNRNYALAQSLAQVLLARGKIVLDSQLAKGHIPSKFHEALIYKLEGVAHIPTYSARDFDALVKVGFGGRYPVVVKDVDSQRGKGVRLCADEASLREEIETHGHTVIVQDFVDIAYDLRVICVGDEVIGAIKRESSSDDFRTNVSLGGSATAVTLSAEEAALALQAHHSLKYDISGVDIAHGPDGIPFVIETNISPEWQGFKSATGIDVAHKIIEYVFKRYTDGQ